MDESGRSAAGDHGEFSRRSFLTGVLGFGAAVGLAGVTEGPLWHQDAFAATAPPPGPPTATLPLPTTTAPEQLLLTWGADPATSVTVSWSAPGTVAQPAPMLAYSTSPITATHPGRVVHLPEPKPLDVTRRYPQAADLVLSGHEHDYERSYPVRGYDAGAHGTVVSPNPDQTAGEAIDTRRPTAVTTEPGAVNGIPAWNTAQGTVFLVLGGGGTNGPSNVYGTDTTTALPRAKVITERNAITGSLATGFHRNSADSVEDAPWSAATNAGDAYGYAIFDVDPGERRGETTITLQYFAIPAVSNEAGSAHDGATTLPTTAFETLVFGRGVPHQPGTPYRVDARALEGSRSS